MTYSALELSAQDGLPVRLYEFRRGQIVYRYTSADRDITWNSQTWAAQPGGFMDAGVRSSGPTEQDEILITCSWDVEVVGIFRGTPPSDPVSLTVRRVHTTDGDMEAVIVWVGLVTSMRQTAPGKAELQCQSVLYTFQQQGLRLTYGRTCPHFLYDDNCRVAKASFMTAVTVDTVSGITVTASGLAAKVDGWFDGGFIEWDLDLLGTKERRPVESHVGNTLTLLTLTDGLDIGTDIAVYPGCARDATTCSTKFNNMPNYGGFPHMPGKSPFEIGVLNLTDDAENRFRNAWEQAAFEAGVAPTERPRTGDGSGGAADGTDNGAEQPPYVDSGSWGEGA